MVFETRVTPIFTANISQYADLLKNMKTKKPRRNNDEAFHFQLSLDFIDEPSLQTSLLKNGLHGGILCSLHRWVLFYMLRQISP